MNSKSSSEWDLDRLSATGRDFLLEPDRRNGIVQELQQRLQREQKKRYQRELLLRSSNNAEELRAADEKDAAESKPVDRDTGKSASSLTSPLQLPQSPARSSRLSKSSNRDSAAQLASVEAKKSGVKSNEEFDATPASPDSTEEVEHEPKKSSKTSKVSFEPTSWELIDSDRVRISRRSNDTPRPSMEEKRLSDGKMQETEPRFKRASNDSVKNGDRSPIPSQEFSPQATATFSADGQPEAKPSVDDASAGAAERTSRRSSGRESLKQAAREPSGKLHVDSQSDENEARPPSNRLTREEMNELNVVRAPSESGRKNSKTRDSQSQETRTSLPMTNGLERGENDAESNFRKSSETGPKTSAIRDSQSQQARTSAPLSTDLERGEADDYSRPTSRTVEKTASSVNYLTPMVDIGSNSGASEIQLSPEHQEFVEQPRASEVAQRFSEGRSKLTNYEVAAAARKDPSATLPRQSDSPVIQRMTAAAPSAFMDGFDRPAAAVSVSRQEVTVSSNSPTVPCLACLMRSLLNSGLIGGAWKLAILELEEAFVIKALADANYSAGAGEPSPPSPSNFQEACQQRFQRQMYQMLGQQQHQNDQPDGLGGPTPGEDASSKWQALKNLCDLRDRLITCSHICA